MQVMQTRSSVAEDYVLECEQIEILDTEYECDCSFNF